MLHHRVSTRSTAPPLQPFLLHHYALLLLLPCLLVRVAAAAVPWRFIDLLPQHAGKGTAMQHVMQHYGYDATATVAAGDSANDLLMLKQVSWHSVPVVSDLTSQVSWLCI
jgi:hypothetical protein